MIYIYIYTMDIIIVLLFVIFVIFVIITVLTVNWKNIKIMGSSETPKYVYMVRHGETDVNKNKMTNKFDVPINETGEKQAKLTGELLANKNIDIIYASTSKRSIQTAEIIKKELKGDVKIIIDKRLREKDTGDLGGISSTDPIMVEWKEDYKDFAKQ